MVKISEIIWVFSSDLVFVVLFFKCHIAKSVKSRFWLELFFFLFAPCSSTVSYREAIIFCSETQLLHILCSLKTSWDFWLVLKFSILSYTWVHFDWYRYKVHVTIQEKHYRLVERQLSSASPCTWSEMNFQIKMCISFLLFDREQYLTGF